MPIAVSIPDEALCSVPETWNAPYKGRLISRDLLCQVVCSLLDCHLLRLCYFLHLFFFIMTLNYKSEKFIHYLLKHRNKLLRITLIINAQFN